jgi:hypothetical protein
MKESIKKIWETGGMTQIQNYYTYWSLGYLMSSYKQKLFYNGRDHYEDLAMYGKIILKWILQK